MSSRSATSCIECYRSTEGGGLGRSVAGLNDDLPGSDMFPLRKVLARETFRIQHTTMNQLVLDM